MKLTRLKVFLVIFLWMGSSHFAQATPTGSSEAKKNEISSACQIAKAGACSVGNSVSTSGVRGETTMGIEWVAGSTDQLCSSKSGKHE